MIHPLLGFLCKIDHDIAAYDKITLGRVRILQQVMLLKLYTALHLIVDLIAAANLRKILLYKLLWQSLQALFIVKSDLCLLENLFIQVGSNDLDPA